MENSAQVSGGREGGSKQSLKADFKRSQKVIESEW